MQGVFHHPRGPEPYTSCRWGICSLPGFRGTRRVGRGRSPSQPACMTLVHPSTNCLFHSRVSSANTAAAARSSGSDRMAGPQSSFSPPLASTEGKYALLAHAVFVRAPRSRLPSGTPPSRATAWAGGTPNCSKKLRNSVAEHEGGGGGLKASRRASSSSSRRPKRKSSFRTARPISRRATKATKPERSLQDSRGCCPLNSLNTPNTGPCTNASVGPDVTSSKPHATRSAVASGATALTRASTSDARVLGSKRGGPSGGGTGSWPALYNIYQKPPRTDPTKRKKPGYVPRKNPLCASGGNMRRYL
eukprot:Hpha_TRINITY_DN30760_c0_g1::TRINITY_DN30760_c0_g1_i1::g.28404::m.28404